MRKINSSSVDSLDGLLYRSCLTVMITFSVGSTTFCVELINFGFTKIIFSCLTPI